MRLFSQSLLSYSEYGLQCKSACSHKFALTICVRSACVRLLKILFDLFACVVIMRLCYLLLGKGIILRSRFCWHFLILKVWTMSLYQINFQVTNCKLHIACNPYSMEKIHPVVVILYLRFCCCTMTIQCFSYFNFPFGNLIISAWGNNGECYIYFSVMSTHQSVNVICEAQCLG